MFPATPHKYICRLESNDKKSGEAVWAKHASFYPKHQCVGPPPTQPPTHPELEFNFAICLLPIEEVVLADAKHPRDHFLRARCVSTTLDPDTMRIDGRARPRSALRPLFLLSLSGCAKCKPRSDVYTHVYNYHRRDLAASPVPRVCAPFVVYCISIIPGAQETRYAPFAL